MKPRKYKVLKDISNKLKDVAFTSDDIVVKKNTLLEDPIGMYVDLQGFIPKSVIPKKTLYLGRQKENGKMQWIYIHEDFIKENPSYFEAI